MRHTQEIFNSYDLHNSTKYEYHRDLEAQIEPIMLGLISIRNKLKGQQQSN